MQLREPLKVSIAILKAKNLFNEINFYIVLEYFRGLLLLLFSWSSCNYWLRRMRRSADGMEEEVEGIIRRTRRSPAEMDEKDGEEITLKLFIFFKLRCASLLPLSLQRRQERRRLWPTSLLFNEGIYVAAMALIWDDFEILF